MEKHIELLYSAFQNYSDAEIAFLYKFYCLLMECGNYEAAATEFCMPLEDVIAERFIAEHA